MVRQRSPLAHELLAEAHREGQVGQVVAVEVAQLDPAEPELDAAEAVWLLADAGPAQHLAADLLDDRRTAATAGDLIERGPQQPDADDAEPDLDGGGENARHRSCSPLAAGRVVYPGWLTLPWAPAGRRIRRRGRRPPFTIHA
jgi:hypothetical protein